MSDTFTFCQGLPGAGLKTFLTERLAKYKIPRTVEIVESLPHTPSGKVM